MEILYQLLRLLWGLLESILSAVVGPFTRAASLRRVDDGSGP